MKQRSLAVLGATILALLAAPAAAKRVICIDLDQEATNSVEGFYTQNAQEGDYLQLGDGKTPPGPASLEDLLKCLAMVKKGDELIIGAHGGAGNFTYGKTTYAGFGPNKGGGGTGVAKLTIVPLPKDFPDGVKIQLWNCYAGTVPKVKNGKSVVQSLQAVLPKATVSGTDGRNLAPARASIVGGTDDEYTASIPCLLAAAKKAGFESVEAWISSMRPADALKATNDALSKKNCPDAGGATRMTITYQSPIPEGTPKTKVVVALAARADFPMEAFFCEHGCASCGDVAVPGKRALFAARCDQSILESGPRAAGNTPCYTVTSGNDRCATPQVSEIAELAYGPNDHSDFPRAGVEADDSNRRDLGCQGAIGQLVASLWTHGLRVCAGCRPSVLGTTLPARQRFRRLCRGVVPVTDSRTGTVIPDVGRPCGPLSPGIPIDTDSLLDCLEAEVNTHVADACPLQGEPNVTTTTVAATTSTTRAPGSTTTTTIPPGGEVEEAEWVFYARIARTDGSETNVTVPKRTTDAPVRAAILADDIAFFRLDDQVTGSEIEALGDDTLARLTSAAQDYIASRPADYPDFAAVVLLNWAKRVAFRCCTIAGPGGFCTWTETDSECTDQGTLGAANSVCDAATGTCKAPPPTAGNCCKLTLDQCVAGPDVTRTSCTNVGGTFFATTTCQPGGACK
jgi:hypothetical protein